MIIRNLDPLGISIDPDKTHSPLIINPDAILAFTLSFQGLETVGRRYPQIIQGSGVADHAQLAPGDFLNIPRQTPRDLAVPYPFGFLIPKSSDHATSITLCVIPRQAENPALSSMRGLG